MKFNILDYSQRVAMSIGLDLPDLHILGWIQDFWPEMKKKIIDGEEYGWIQYGYFIKDMPIVKINTADGLYRRLKKLEEKGLLKHKGIKDKEGSFSYYKITPKIVELLKDKPSFGGADNNPDGGKDEKSDGQDQNPDGKDEKSEGVRTVSRTKDNPTNNNSTISISSTKNFQKSSEWELFFDTFWSEYKRTKDKDGNEGDKGSKSDAKKVFKSLVEDGESPVYIIWGMKAYIKKIDGKVQNCHAVTFLRQKRYEEFIEDEIARIEAQNKQQTQKQSEVEKIEDLSNSEFWIVAKNNLMDSIEIPEKWKESIKIMKYLGENQGVHVIAINSKFYRDWMAKEYGKVFDKAIGKWQLIFKEF